MFATPKHTLASDDRTRKLFIPLLLVSAGLCVVEISLFIIIRLNLDISPLFGTLYTFVSINEEGTVASWYSAGLWLIAGLLAVVLYFCFTPRKPSWLIMAAVAFYASADEATEIHEYFYHLGDIMAAWMPFSVGFTWVLPGALVAILVAGFF